MTGVMKGGMRLDGLFTVSPVFLTVSLVFLASCAVGSMGGERDDAVAYTVLERNPLVFLRTDSVALVIEVPLMGSVEVFLDQRATLGLAFEPHEDGVQVTAEVREFSGRITSPFGAPVTVSESDVEGVLVFTVDRRGRARVVSTPEVSGAVAAIFSGDVLAHELLPLLPPGDVSVGTSWTDTIRYAGGSDIGGSDMSLDVTWVGTSTLMGDTTVAGTVFTLVRTSADIAIAGDLVIGGTTVRREVAGPETGFYLWDASRKTVVLYEVTRDLVGEVEADIAPLPLRVSARQHSVLKLLDG